MIQFAGVNTLLPTREVMSFIDEHLSQEWSSYFHEPAIGSGFGGDGPYVPRLNWKPVFSPKLNTLIWPTGASRWASILLLVTDEQMDTITTAVNVSSSGNWLATAAQLKLADGDYPVSIGDDGFENSGNRVALSTAMYALAPRPISLPYEWNGTAWVESTERTLWILPLVDERWFWQWKPVDSLSEQVTWTEVFNTLGTALGTGIATSTIATEYLSPVDQATKYNHGNSALLADATAYTVGQRISRDLNGNLYSRTYADAQAVWDANTDAASYHGTAFTKWQRIAGGQYSGGYKSAATMPASIKFNFSGDSVVETTLDAAGGEQWRASTSLIVFLGVSGDNTERQSFADLWTADYIGWQSRKADLVFAGIKAWKPTGFEDVVIWTHGALTGDTYRSSTRVMTMPENLNVNGMTVAKSAARIRFTILSASFSVGLGALGCDHVVAIVNHISCGGTGVNVGDEVLVYDPEYCHFNLPIPLLVGLSGQATMMSSANYQPGLEYLLDCVAETQAAGCIWMIDNLCCSEEEIISG